MFHRTILQLLSIFIIYMCTISSVPIEENPIKSVESYSPYTCYKCFAEECDNPYNITCDDGEACFTRSEIVNENQLIREKGCHRVPFGTVLYCNLGIVWKRRNDTSRVHTCCYGNFCNDDEFEMPSIPEPTTPCPPSKIKNKQGMKKNKQGMKKNKQGMKKNKQRIRMKGKNSKKITLTRREFEEIILTKGFGLVSTAFLAGAITALTALIMGVAFFISTRRIASDIKKPDVIPKLHHKSTANHTYDGFWTSGSGSGLPTLNQRSLSQDVTLIERIGKGRFGEVWKGTMLGENVAVKIFSSVDVDSYENEVKIYTTIALYHENVLGFKGSAIVSRLGVTELWLLTAFHQQGSLYDYLLENTVSHEQMMLFVRSACSGLLHLHTEIFGWKGKPAIAHRDLKTRNVLLTSHGTCVIADFGLAVVKNDESSSKKYPENYMVGTKRYMAPELLDESVKTNSFESFKRADMYAFGLMLWEICSRCVVDGTDETFRLAFHDCVPDNPDFEDMKQVVCIESKRPEIPNRWSSDKTLNTMAELMKHCWHQNPEVRYTAHRVKKTLDKMHAQIQEMQSTVKILRL